MEISDLSGLARSAANELNSAIETLHLAKQYHDQGDYERAEIERKDALLKAVTAIEWALKWYLATIVKLPKYVSGHYPTLVEIIDDAQKHAQPPLEPLLAGRIQEFRNYRNKGTHEAKYPGDNDAEKSIVYAQLVLETYLDYTVQANLINVHLPPPTESQFIGREQYLRRLSSLLIGKGENKVVAIVGTPGVGKTTLARQFADLHSAEFPEGVLWCSAQQANSATIVQTLVELLNVEAGGTIFNQPWAAWHKYLSSRRLLIIIDSLEDIDPRSLRLGGPDDKCKTILTTRNRHIADSLGVPAEAVIELDDLTEGESIEVLKQILQRDIEDPELECAHQLVQRLGHLPFAIELAAKAAKKTEVSICGYVLKLKNAKQPLTILIPMISKQVRGVYDTFAVSLESLSSAQIDFFACLGVSIASGFTKQMALQLGEDIDCDALEALTSFHALSLLRRIGHNRYAFHPLLQDFARQLAEERGLRLDAERKYYGRFERLIAQFPAWPADKVRENLPVLLPEVEGILATAEWKLTQPQTDMSDWRAYWRGMRKIIETRGYYDRAISLLEIALTQVERTRTAGFEPDSGVSSVSLEAYFAAQLGKFYSLAGKMLDAKQMLERALELETDPDRVEHVTTSLGRLKSRTGQRSEAISILFDNLDRADGSSVENTLFNLNALARSLIDDDQVPKALTFLERALRLEDTQPHDKQSRIISLTEKGRALVRTSPERFEDAATCFLEALALSEAQSDLRSISIANNELGEVFLRLGRDKDAIEYAFAGFTAAQDMVDSRSQVIARKRFFRVLSGVVEHAKQFKNSRDDEQLPAAQLAVEAWLAGERMLGERRFEFWALIDLGDILARRGDPDGALEQYSKALDNARERADPRGVSISHQVRARVLSRLDETSKRQAMDELTCAEIIELQRGGKGEMCRVLTAKAKILADLGQRNNAARAIESALARETEDPAILNLANRLGLSVNFKRVEKLTVGQVFKITHIPREKPFAYIRSEPKPGSPDIHFYFSELESPLEQLNLNVAVMVDYYQKPDGRLSANRVVIIEGLAGPEIRHGES